MLRCKASYALERLARAVEGCAGTVVTVMDAKAASKSGRSSSKYSLACTT